MNESDMPREWWYEQDQDEAWIKKQEEDLRQYEQMSTTPLLLDGFDDALIGFGVQFDQKVAIYDYARCLDVLERGGMSATTAIEHMEYSVLGEYSGRRTPVFLSQPVKKTKRRRDARVPGQLMFDFDV